MLFRARLGHGHPNSQNFLAMEKARPRIFSSVFLRQTYTVEYRNASPVGALITTSLGKYYVRAILSKLATGEGKRHGPASGQGIAAVPAVLRHRDDPGHGQLHRSADGRRHVRGAGRGFGQRG